MQNQHVDYYLKQFDVVRWVPRQMIQDQGIKIMIILDKPPAPLEKRLLNNFIKSLGFDESEVEINTKVVHPGQPKRVGKVIYCFGLDESVCEQIGSRYILPSLSEIIKRPALKRLLWGKLSAYHSSNARK